MGTTVRAPVSGRFLVWKEAPGKQMGAPRRPFLARYRVGAERRLPCRQPAYGCRGQPIAPVPAAAATRSLATPTSRAVQRRTSARPIRAFASMTRVFGPGMPAIRQVRRSAPRNCSVRFEGTAAATGGASFSSLVQPLAVALRVGRVDVAECIDAERARRRAVWARGAPRPPSSRLAGTPCMNVTKGQTCLYARPVQRYCPENTFLPAIDAQSYLGISVVRALDESPAGGVQRLTATPSSSPSARRT